MSPPFRWFIGGALILTGVLILALSMGCASSGFYAMSDEWCAKHPEASPARCNRNPLKEYDVQGHQPAGGAPTVDICPGQYVLIIDPATPLYCWGSK